MGDNPLHCCSAGRNLRGHPNDFGFDGLFRAKVLCRAVSDARTDSARQLLVLLHLLKLSLPFLKVFVASDGTPYTLENSACTAARPRVSFWETGRVCAPLAWWRLVSRPDVVVEAEQVCRI